MRTRAFRGAAMLGHVPEFRTMEKTVSRSDQLIANMHRDTLLALSEAPGGGRGSKQGNTFDAEARRY